MAHPPVSKERHSNESQGKRLDSRLSVDEEEDLFKYSVDDQVASSQNLILQSQQQQIK